MTSRPANERIERSRISSEVSSWKPVGAGWHRLSGSFRDLGYSLEWHDFRAEGDFDWGKTFHPEGVEICLNVAGSGEVRGERDALRLEAGTVGFYAQKGAGLKAFRRGGERHQFLTVEMSLGFLEARASGLGQGLHPVVANCFREGPGVVPAATSEPARLNAEHRQIVESLRRPPVCVSGRPMWYEAKVLELAATLLYRPLAGEDFFCQRVKRLNRERAQKVAAILKESLAAPPRLEEIGRRVGCSPYHLSRIFSQETGKTITACLRELRLERAAQLLATGECNVTEAAFEVGYNSLSHFTVAFRDAFGCCPGLYPLKAAVAACPPGAGGGRSQPSMASSLNPVCAERAAASRRQ